MKKKKFSFVFTDQDQDSWGIHHTDLRFQSEGKKLASKKQGHNPCS